LSARKADLAGVLRLAEKGPVLLTDDGREFLVSKADDFAAEIEALRQSIPFQAFLDKRLCGTGWTSLAEIEKEIAADLAKGKKGSRRKAKGKGKGER